MKRNILFLLSVLFVLAGCSASTPLMKTYEPETPPDIINADESAIIFLRPEKLGYAIQSPVAEIIDGDAQFVAIVSYNTKFIYKTTPGKHYFVVAGETGDVLEANLDAGKIYYVRISPRMGTWKARFVFDPVINLSAPGFIKNVQEASWYTNTDEGFKWFSDNKRSFIDKYSASQDEIKILKPEFGVETPIR